MSNIIGVSKSQNGSGGLLNRDYINIGLTDVDAETIEKDLAKWLKRDDYFRNYLHVGFLRDTDVLVRLYRYERETSVLSPSGKSILQTQIVPICKVITISPDSPKKIVSGDILYPPEDISLITVNPMWLEWKKIMENSRPVPEGLPEPDKQLGLILDWRKLYQFSLNKLSPTEDDRYTFLLPYTLFRAHKSGK